ncbi:hypothetical protein FOTG_14909 [Fusarium oxysporum f. sp. vasinfectum 25433]|uniref:Uncharacterized protein n=1 Tax=Fusarium oxysporum f. sp. vasinfectum 25433 TaxID=1089449 RepID=X0KTD1_FUSOX|nr:hypothetical protein FOTG_14909 [Fusarium oxysporum f. sp. vasinfectum 25433]
MIFERVALYNAEQIRLTTLDEYIVACHASVFSRLSIGTDPKLASRGFITDPRNKWCPEKLRPWPDFLDQQKLTFGTLYESFSPERPAFESRNFLAGLGNRTFSTADSRREDAQMFHPDALSDVAEEAVDKATPSTPPRRT